jgi:hypothetical protein
MRVPFCCDKYYIRMVFQNLPCKLLSVNPLPASFQKIIVSFEIVTVLRGRSVSRECGDHLLKAIDDLQGTGSVAVFVPVRMILDCQLTVSSLDEGKVGDVLVRMMIRIVARP